MDPLFSTTIAEFESEEQAASYDRWFRAKVQKSLEDPRPSIPNEQVMADMKALMAELRIKHEAREALREEAPTPHIDRCHALHGNDQNPRPRSRRTARLGALAARWNSFYRK